MNVGRKAASGGHWSGTREPSTTHAQLKLPGGADALLPVEVRQVISPDCRACRHQLPSIISDTLNPAVVAARTRGSPADLARSLNNFSLRLYDVGRREDALAAIHEAVHVYRELAGARPDVFRAELATALNNLSLRLADLAYKDDALATMHEVVEVYRELAAARPDAFRHNLAVALKHLTIRLADVGHDDVLIGGREPDDDVYPGGLEAA